MFLVPGIPWPLMCGRLQLVHSSCRPYIGSSSSLFALYFMATLLLELGEPIIMEHRIKKCYSQRNQGSHIRKSLQSASNPSRKGSRSRFTTKLYYRTFYTLQVGMHRDARTTLKSGSRAHDANWRNYIRPWWILQFIFRLSSFLRITSKNHFFSKKKVFYSEEKGEFF